MAPLAVDSGWQRDCLDPRSESSFSLPDVFVIAHFRSSYFVVLFAIVLICVSCWEEKQSSLEYISGPVSIESKEYW